MQFGTPRSITLSGYTGSAMEPFLARDGSGTLFWNNSNSDPDTNLWYGTQDRNNPTHVVFKGAVANANSPVLDGVPSMDLANNFYFTTTRSYDPSQPAQHTIYSGKYLNGAISNVAPVPSISADPPYFDMDGEISPDGTIMWMCEALGGTSGLAQSKIKLLVLQNGKFVVSPYSDAILATVNAAGTNYAPSVTPDLLTMCFTRYDVAAGPTPQLYLASRTSPYVPFNAPVLLSQATGFVEGGCISPDGRSIIFHHMKADGSFELQIISQT